LCWLKPVWLKQFFFSRFGLASGSLASGALLGLAGGKFMGRFAPDNFVDSGQRDFVVFVVSACGLSACCLVVLVCLLRGLPRCRGVPWAAQASGGLCGWRPCEDGAFEASLREEVERRRLARALRMIPWAMLLVIVNFFVTTVPSGLHNGSVSRFGSTIQDIVLSLMSGMISVMWASQWARVSIVTARSLDYWYYAFMVCIVAYMSPYAIRADLVAYRMNMSYGSALLCCLFNLKPLVNIPCLLLLGAMSSYTLMFGQNAEKMQEYSSQDVLSDGIQNVMLMVVILLVISHLLTYIVRLEFDAKVSRNELVVANSVLRSVCEVVVDLDEKFRLQKHSGELADMLFLNPQRSLNQEDFRSFLASEPDRIKFTEQMGQMMVQASCPEIIPDRSRTFQVSMKDSTGISVNVDVVAVSYLSGDRLPAFMVGVLEVSDSTPLPSLMGPTEKEATSRRRPRRRPKQDLQGEPPRPPLGPPEEAGGSSGSSSGSDLGAVDVEQPLDLDCGRSRSGSAWSGTADFEGEAPAVVLEVLSHSFTMLAFTDSFQHSFGPCSVGEPFLTWVKLNHREQFVAWLQEAWLALRARSAEGEASVELYPRALHFMPARLRQHRLGFSATVFLGLAPAPAAPERDMGAVRITLSNVRRLTAGRSGRGGPRGGSRLGRRPDGGPHPGGAGAAEGELEAEDKVFTL
ncbi:unnamed protein product, partial [Prorocentrum cordatum]